LLFWFGHCFVPESVQEFINADLEANNVAFHLSIRNFGDLKFVWIVLHHIHHLFIEPLVLAPLFSLFALLTSNIFKSLQLRKSN